MEGKVDAKQTLVGCLLGDASAVQANIALECGLVYL
jgi:hypothetical protein